MLGRAGGYQGGINSHKDLSFSYRCGPELLSSLRPGFDQDHRQLAGPTAEADVTQMGVYISLELPTAFPFL